MRIRKTHIFFLRMVLAAIPFLFLNVVRVNGQYNENLIKAAYIERITRFVEWPANEKLTSQDLFIIGVYYEDEFLDILNTVFKEKSIKEHKVKVISIKSPEQINACNICYISTKAKSSIGKFIGSANSSGVLLISGTPGFSKAGVHINFYVEEEKLKFEINETSIVSAGFKVSYLLLQNNRIIK
jgi:preprotein translocase subunit Sec61beta